MAGVKTIVSNVTKFLTIQHCFDVKKRPDKAVLGYKNSQIPVFWKDFRHDVAKLLRHLPSEKAVILVCNDPYSFIVCFFALAWLGKNIILPSNFQPETLKQTAHNLNAVIVTESDINTFLALQEPVSVEGTQESCFDAVTVTVFTSGSTGQSMPITKPFSTFTTEVQTLHQIWGNLIQDTVFVSTVPPYHTYGLLFSVLWPVCSGCPLTLKTAEYPSDLNELMEQHQGVSFISSPAFLDRFVKGLSPNGSSILPVRFIASSGSPLGKETADGLEQVFPRLTYEIYGSTETGGIATRQQCHHSAWSALPHVEWNIEAETNRLTVRSPYTYAGGDWVTLADCGEVVSDTTDKFILKGRSDRIVKIHEKRISLDLMENALKQHPSIRHARLVVLPDSGRLGAVVILTQQGQEALKASSSVDFISLLKHHLHGHFDWAVLPRKWRFVDTLPTNTMGKTSVDSLLDLFSSIQSP